MGEGGATAAATTVPVVEVEVAGESRVALLDEVGIPPAKTSRGSEKFCCSESSWGVIVL